MFNYFSILCFIWALIGIFSRLLMVFLGVKWNKWELTKAYSEKKPTWIYLIGVFSILIIIFTWYQVFTLNLNIVGLFR